MEITAIKRVTS